MWFSLFLCAEVALILLTGIFATVAGYKTNRRCPSPQDQVIFRKSWTSRLVGVLFSFLTATCPVLIFWTGSRDHANMPFQTSALFATMTLLFFATSVAILRLAGPEDLVLDLRDHTYRQVSGWPLFPATHNGGWEEIQGISVWKNGGSTPVYIVSVVWARRSQRTQIGTFYYKSRANIFAQDIASVLRLPVTVLV